MASSVSTVYQPLSAPSAEVFKPRGRRDKRRVRPNHKMNLVAAGTLPPLPGLLPTADQPYGDGGVAARRAALRRRLRFTLASQEAARSTEGMVLSMTDGQIEEFRRAGEAKDRPKSALSVE
jgi:hypothetical protein